MTTVPSLVSLVEDVIDIRPLAPRTRVSYEDLVSLHIRPRWGDTPVTDVSYRDLQRWLSDIAVTRPALAHRVHVVVRQALRLAVIDDLVSKNVADYVKLPRAPRKDVKALEPWEFRELLKELPTDRDRLMAEMMAVGGLRFCEVAALRPESVAGSGVLVEASITPKRGGGFNVGPTKTHQQRIVQLPEKMLADLRKYALRRVGETLLFANKAGNPIDIGNWSARVLQPACERAHIQRISPHVLRHTSATAALHAGIPVHVVAKHLGHQDAGVTLQFYAGTWQEKLKDLATAVGCELLEEDTTNA